MFFTPGNIITLILSLTLVISFRQMDKNNRSIEKVKKFGDKLKDDLEIFIKERAGKLEESTLSLDVEQQRAIAAVKRLDAIREDISRREDALLERTSAIADMGSKLDAYDHTIKQLLEMTSLADENLKRISVESDFADSLGRKVLASRKQIEAISAALPALREDFTRENRESLESIQSETLLRIEQTAASLERQVEITRAETEKILAEASAGLNELYSNSFAEASKRADDLEDASFKKLRDQATERLSKYKSAIEEKTATLNELAREKLQETQQQLKTFRSTWQEEAKSCLEIVRTETSDALLAARNETSALAQSVQKENASLAETVLSKTAEVLAAARGETDALAETVKKETLALTEMLQTETFEAVTSARTETAALAEIVKKETSGVLATARAETTAYLEDLQAETSEAFAVARQETAELTETVSSETATLAETVKREISALLETTRTETARASAVSKTEASRIIQTVRIDTEESVSTLRSEALDAVTTLRNDAMDSLDVSRNELLSSIEAVNTDLSGQVTNFQDTTSEAIEAAQHDIDSFITKTRGEIAHITEEKNIRLSNLEEKLHKAEASAKVSADEFFSVLNQRTGQLDSKISEISDSIQGEIDSFQKSISDQLNTATKAAEDTSREISAQISTMDSGLAAAVAEARGRLEADLSKVSSRLSGEFAGTAAEIDSSLAQYRTEISERLQRFDDSIGDVERLDGELRTQMAETSRHIQSDFSGFIQEQQGQQKEFAQQFLASGEVLSERMQTLEQGLNELKSRAYENVSEKLKVFEDDFFADLASRGEAINTALDNWKSNVDARLDTLTAESESSRKETDALHAAQFKERLSEIAEQYRMQSDRLEDQIVSIETDLRSRITASDQSLLSFVEQYRVEFEQARSKAATHAQDELDTHALSIQEALRRQEREIEHRTKDFVDTLDVAKTDAETVLQNIRSDFTSWQNRNDQQLASARSLVDDRISALEKSAADSISNIEASWESTFRDFLVGTEDERSNLASEIESLQTALATAGEEFNLRSSDALKEFRASYQTMTTETERQLRETGVETDQTLRSLKFMVQEIREGVEENREKLFQKLQSDTSVLSTTLEEIDRKQKGFIAQTRIFERADQLKIALDADIENLRTEVSRLDVYRGSMNSLEQQYTRVRKLEEEATQKISNIMSEKKRIDLLETDFTNLMALSESVDRKMGELTVTDDDIQQYQVQIRRFEDSISEVNARYERMEKKAVVLDQTVTGIDRAFETLKSFESSLLEYRQIMDVMPGELANIRRDLDTILQDEERVGKAVTSLSTLDETLVDIEARIEKMQSGREWLGRTETRLAEISKDSEDQLKLLAGLLKDDGAAKKAKGAPPLGIRESVVKLAHQGWKLDEISRALHLSLGEVELILELPQK